MLTSMPHIPQNLGLLGFSSLKSSSFAFFLRPFSLYPIFASSPSSSRPIRPRTAGYRRTDLSPRFPPKRKWSSFEEERSRQRKNMSPMEKDKANFNHSSNPFEFNKKRAEGKDKTDKPKKNLKRKTRTLNPTNTIAYVQVLGTGMDTQDTSPSVLLFFDKQRFIFNAGEGLQRFCTEHKIKLSKVDHIFLSRVCSETAGGLPGLLLTLAGIGEEGLSVNVWGPSDLKYLVDAMRSFIPRAAMVHTRSFGPSFTMSDSTLQISSSKPKDDPFVLVDDEVVKISAILLEPSRPKDSRSKLAETSVIYVCELPEIKGKFDPQKAMMLGLRAGPKYSILQSGQSVKSDFKDITVHPSDVMGPSVPGPVVLIVDCPTESHAEELLSSPSMQIYYSCPENSTDGSKCVNCIIHLSPASVTNTPTYQSWMKRFHSAQHILAGHETKNIEFPILKASSRITARLNYLCPQFFPAPGFWPSQPVNDSIYSTSLSKCFGSSLGESISAENLLKFTLRPHGSLGLDRSCIPSQLTPSRVMDELLSEIPEISCKTEEVKQLWNGLHNRMMIEEPWLSESTIPSCLKNIRRDDMEIVLLGTGSSQPSKYRNVSAVYIDLFSKGSILLDCGEGTLGQLKRRYGLEGADEAVRNLKCIWISHIHADHHTGLARILAHRQELLKGMAHEPAIVVGPRQLKNFLDAYQRLEDLDMEFLDCRNTTTTSWGSLETTSPKKVTSIGNAEGSLFSKGSPMQSIYKRPSNNSSALPYLKKLKKILGEMGLDDLISFPVVHCPQAFGVVLKAAERRNMAGDQIPGWKMVYSGDTRPCPEMVEASKGATVLIHEATFEDALVEEAVARNHSTTKEAIDVGSSAGVYRIVLTHFSQRYPKIPVIDESHMHNTCIAFDMMSINMADLHVLPKIVPYFKSLFRNEETDDDDDDDNDDNDDDDALTSDKVPSFLIN